MLQEGSHLLIRWNEIDSGPKFTEGWAGANVFVHLQPVDKGGGSSQIIQMFKMFIPQIRNLLGVLSSPEGLGLDLWVLFWLLCFPDSYSQ